MKSFVPISGGREKKYFAFIWPVLVTSMTSLNRSAEAASETWICATDAAFLLRVDFDTLAKTNE